MEVYSFIAHHFAKQNDVQESKKYIKLASSIYNEINKGLIDLDWKFNFSYHLMMAYKILNDIENFDKFSLSIFEEIGSITKRLNSTQKKMFLDRYPINKIMELKLNKNHL